MASTSKPTLGHWVRTFFKHGSNGLLVLSSLALLTVVAVQAPAIESAGWVLLGIAIFPLHEYVFHRFVLHAKPSKFAWVHRIQRAVHYDHHEDPNRLDRLFMPMLAFFPLALAQFGLYLLLGAKPLTAAALLAGNLLGFLYYEWVHYTAHIPVTPKTAWGKAMKKYHLWHHHKNEGYWYGVTTPLVDTVMRTKAPVETVPQSPSAKRLFGSAPQA
jgi:hypothetical protein